MNKFKSKKGFTLAELLIVVAIIAVLVAIAVPLFVGGLKKAQEGTFAANQRAVRAAAVVAILSGEYSGETGAYDVDTLFADGNEIYVSAIVNESGDMSSLTIPAATKTETKFDAWNADKTTPIVVKVTKIDLEKS